MSLYEGDGDIEQKRAEEVNSVGGTPSAMQYPPVAFWGILPDRGDAT